MNYLGTWGYWKNYKQVEMFVKKMVLLIRHYKRYAKTNILLSFHHITHGF